MDFRTAPHAKIKYVLQRYLFMLPNVHFSVCHSSFVITSGVTLLKGSWGSDSAPISHDSTSSLWSSGFDLAAVLTHPGLLIGVCLPSTGWVFLSFHTAHTPQTLTPVGHHSFWK